MEKLLGDSKSKTSISGVNFVRMRELSEQLDLTNYQAGNFLIFLASIDDELQTYILSQLDAREFKFPDETKYPYKEELT